MIFPSAVICLFALLLFNPTSSKAVGAGKTPDKNELLSIDTELIQGTSEIDIEGKIIFHRPQGIYLADLSRKTPVLLIKNGSYPRWSPDGKLITYIRGNSIMLFNLDKKRSVKLAQANKARAVCFTNNGTAVLFTDGKFLKQVDLDSLSISTILSNEKCLEIDSSLNGKTITATVKALGGFKVKIFTFPDLKGETIGRGCSASLSPDGKFVTVNNLNHTALHLYNTDTLKKISKVPTPANIHFDNQFWSNHPQWIVSSSEGKFSDIFIHHIQDGRSQRITFSGESDRGDLFIPIQK